MIGQVEVVALLLITTLQEKALPRPGHLDFIIPSKKVKDNMNRNCSSEKAKVTKQRIVFYLLSSYFVVSLFGNVFRFAAKEDFLGVGTILLCLIAALTFKDAVSKIFKNRVWFALFLLLVWLLFSSYFGDWEVGYFRLFMLTIYFLFAAGLSTLKFTLKKLDVLYLTIIITLLISTLLTLLDLGNVVDVPYFNDFSEGVRTADNIRIAGASGPFMGRSSLATYLGLLLPLISIYGFLSRRKVIQILTFAALISGLIVLLVSFSRAGILAACISTLVFCVFAGNKLRERTKVFGGFVLGLFLSLIIIYICFPSQMRAIKYKVNLTLGIGNYTKVHFTRQRKADLERVFVAEEIIKKIVANPFGYGLTSIERTGSAKKSDSHNNILQIIWAAGFFGFFWLFFFAICLISTFRKAYLSHAPHYEGIKYALFAWFLISLVHTNWATGTMWALFGILFHGTQGTRKPCHQV